MLKDGKCYAPSFYNYGCANVKDTSRMTPLEKSNWALTCKAPWKCLGMGDQDFSQACPAGWKEDNGVCKAPLDYDGPCIRSVNFEDYSESLKREWGLICEVFWPTNASFLEQEECTYLTELFSFVKLSERMDKD